MKYTDKLGLKKPDLNDYVNVGDLNENMDIVDTEVDGVKTDLDTHKADNAAIKHKAKTIALEDPNFTSNNVEEGMGELFTNVSNGKQLVGNAITGVDDSVMIPTEPSFNDLAGAIGGISTGKKWASGSSSVQGSLADTFLEIRNLNFTPKTLIVTGGEFNKFLCLYSKEMDPNKYIPGGNIQNGRWTVFYFEIAGNIETYADGIKINLSRPDYTNLNWIAFE